MFLHILLFIFLLCYYLISKGNIKLFLFFVLIYSFGLSFEMVNEYFFSLTPTVYFNSIILLYVALCNILIFTLYYKLSKNGILGCAIYAAAITAISAIKISIPLNPIILYYKYNLFILPQTNSPLLNLYVINLLPALFFLL